MAKEFTSEGHHVDVVTPGPTGKSNHNLGGKLDIVYFPRRGIPFREKISILNNLDLRKFCLLYTNEHFFAEVARYLLDNNYDVIHTNGFPFEALPNTFQKESVSVHTFHTQPTKPARLPNRLIYRRLFKFIDHTTCVSQSLVRDIALNLGLSVTNVITNGVDLEFFKPAVSQEAGSGLVIGSVTNFNWKDKAFGLKLLIDSIKALEMQDLPPTGSKLVIVGNGIYRNEIMDYAGSLALKNVFFRTAKYEEMPSVYNEFDIYVHASGQEGFSVSILEALACGKPVVTSSRITELTSLKAVQIVQSREEMISALRTLITDVEMRRKLGVVARREVENYSLRTIANQYLKLYNTR